MRKKYIIPIILLVLGVAFIVFYFNINNDKFFSLIWIGLVLIGISIVIFAILFVLNVFSNTKKGYGKDFDRKIKRIFPKAFYEKLGRMLFPKYNEIVLFALAITVSFLFLIDKDFNQKIVKILFEDGRIFFALMMGLLASFYYFFSKKQKTQAVKKFMSFFLLFFSCFVCFYSIKFNENIFSFIISVINSVYLFFVILSYIILIQYKSSIIEELVSDYKPSVLEKIFSFVIIGGIFYINYFLIKMNWIATMSVMIFYTNLLHKGFSKLLFNMKNN